MKKKFFAGLLSLIMMLSMVMTAFAAEPDTILQESGSLTITKTESTDTEGEAGPIIEGVTFKMYKIADISQELVNGVVDTSVVPVVDGLAAGDLEKIANGTASTQEWTALLEKVKLEDLAVEYTATTNVNGVAVFDPVSLGIYAVEEASAPSQVISRSANFIVSIPMTDKTGDQWVYDVKTSPKNAVSRGGISLKKTGKVGNGETSTLAGVQFVLQTQVDDKWVNVSADKVSADILTTNAQGIISVENLEPGKYRFIEASLGSNEGYILDASTTYEFELKIGENGVTEVWIDGVNQGATYTIEVLNEKPTLEKTVLDGEKYDNETDVNIGDTVTWKVEASVPSKIDQMSTYTLTDTMSAGLTWVSEEAAELVVVASNGAKTIELVKGTDYVITVPEDGAKGATWTIIFTDDGKDKLVAYTTVTVTFNTELNEDAKISNDGKVGNINTAGLIYSNNIVPDSELYPEQPKEPTEETIKDEATVYTFGLSVEKVDGTNNATKLAGVEFDLYRYEPAADEKVTEETLKENGELITHLTTDEKGQIEKTGLANGTYYLVETKTNADYNLLKEPVKVEISVVYTTTTTTTTTTEENGNVTITTVKTETFTGGEKNNGIFKTVIENNKGFQLPTTGGMGMFMFTLIGGVLIIGGAFIMTRSRKKTA